MISLCPRDLDFLDLICTIFLTLSPRAFIIQVSLIYGSVLNNDSSLVGGFVHLSLPKLTTQRDSQELGNRHPFLPNAKRCDGLRIGKLCAVSTAHWC